MPALSPFTPRRPRAWRRCLALAALAAAVPVAGCTSPMERSSEQALRDQLIASHRRQLEATADAGIVTLHHAPSAVEKSLSKKRKKQLDQMAGPAAYQGKPVDLGEDLAGKTSTDTVSLSLRRAVRLAVKNNLDLRVGALAPAIAQAQITQAQAAFDSVLFGSVQWQKRDITRPPGSFPGFGGGGGPAGLPQGTIPGLAGDQQTQQLDVTAGIRKDLPSGGRVTLQTDLTRREESPTFFVSPSFYNSDLRLQIDQPLLRGFGSDVNRARIVLAKSAKSARVQKVKSALLDTVRQVEAAYWDLSLARSELVIQQHLLKRTNSDRDRLVKRKNFDVSPVRITEANSFVELRRSEVIRARQRVRKASDRLKQLMNAPGLPVSGETLIVPTDAPADAPIRFSLLDAVTTALRQRPELTRALLKIKDASTRQRVADNARLPLLNLTAAIAYNGLDLDNAADSYGDLAQGDYINYILGGKFEAPIGNRRADAAFTQRRLERKQAVLAYQRRARDVVVEVKNALRDIRTQYELIGATRAARRAAADSLRAIEQQERAGVALTPEFLLDLKFQAQRRLATAQQREAKALRDYNDAVARFYRTEGTLLKRNHIDIEAPSQGAG